MKSLNEKEMVMGSLGKLKTAPENFRRINVTDDYTIDERQLIKNKVAEAKHKTEVEGDGKFVWKVRGTPKNGLRLIKFILTTLATRDSSI